MSSFKSESLSVYFNRITYLFTLATFEVVGLTGRALPNRDILNAAAGTHAVPAAGRRDRGGVLLCSERPGTF